MTVRPEDTHELRQGPVEILYVTQCDCADDQIDRVVGKWQVVQVGFVEDAVGHLLSGAREHLGRGVDTDHLVAERLERARLEQQQLLLSLVQTLNSTLVLNQVLEQVLGEVHRLKASRVVIDSLSCFELTLAPTFREDFRESLLRLVAALAEGLVVNPVVYLMIGRALRRERDGNAIRCQPRRILTGKAGQEWARRSETGGRVPARK